ncbi:MAG: hypothetical protein ABS61_01610 [Microbacterium sp. SCN 70-18]|nr:MAG: hypothetical protein ABS61_01610 [Microbacterium sp. SCN 70-18]
MTAHARVRAHAEFMRIWEEGYVATTATFDAMHMQGVAILDGAPLRGADGRLDRAGIASWIEDATRGIPYARLRLMRSPLGLTPPAWVPDASFDVKHHVRFDEDDVALSTRTLPRLIGWDAGPLTLTRPLWRVTFTTLTDGRVAMGLLMHHSGGDALRTLSFLSALTVSKPDAAPKPAADPFAQARAPRIGGGLVLQALAQWRAEPARCGRGPDGRCTDVRGAPPHASSAPCETAAVATGRRPRIPPSGRSRRGWCKTTLERRTRR